MFEELLSAWIRKYSKEKGGGDSNNKFWRNFCVLEIRPEQKFLVCVKNYRGGTMAFDRLCLYWPTFLVAQISKSMYTQNFSHVVIIVYKLWTFTSGHWVFDTSAAQLNQQGGAAETVSHCIINKQKAFASCYIICPFPYEKIQPVSPRVLPLVGKTSHRK